MSNPLDLSGKICIITGAGKGIGLEAAKSFYLQGAKLALISRTKSDLLALQQELDASDDDLFCFAGDAADETTVNQFVDMVIEKFGRIDVLINNAGIRFRKGFQDITLQEWSNVMSVNAGSCFLFCQSVGKHMILQQSGKIINMASIIGTLGLPELAAYGASKGAIISMSKSLAVEWAKYNININVIAPGFCETSYADNFKKNRELYQFTLDRTPSKKWGSSKDISNSCLFLASSMSDYMTGEVISVDGGWSAW